MKHSIGGEILTLLPQRAIYWEAQRTLFVADVHLGKAAHFRKHGLAVPLQAELENLKQLTYLLQTYNPQKLIILGDLFHHKLNSIWDLFIIWRCQFRDVEMILIIGNHDILKPHVYEMADLIVYNDVCKISPFILSHHPLQTVPEGFYNIAGHIHPAVTVRLSTKQTVTLKCFYFQKQNLIMPSFGAFTGNHVISPKSDDKIFVITDETVLLV